MNSKQRRQSKRKHIYRVKINEQRGWTELYERTKWLRTIEGSWCRNANDIYGFSNEQYAIMFGLKFAGS